MSYYTITSYDGNFTIQSDTVDGPGFPSANSALQLPGKDWSGWGEFYSNNFIHLLENFAVGQPSNPRTGQLWYNPGPKTLNLWDASIGSWQPVNGELAAPVTINLSGDATGTVIFQGGGNYNLPVTLNSIVTAGTYEKVTVDVTGRVVHGALLTATDIETALGFVPANSIGAGSVTSIGLSSSTSTISISGSPITSSGTIEIDLPNVVSSGTYEKVTVDAYGRVTAGTNLSGSDISSALGYVPIPAIVSGTLAVSGALGNDVELASFGTAGTYEKVIVDLYGRVSSGSNLTLSDIVAALGFTPVSTASFTENFAYPGWVKFPNGLIIQWGFATSSASYVAYTSSSPNSTTWPISFPNACLAAFAQSGPQNGNSQNAAAIYNSNYIFANANGGIAVATAYNGTSMHYGPYGFQFLAIGY